MFKTLSVRGDFYEHSLKSTLQLCLAISAYALKYYKIPMINLGSTGKCGPCYVLDPLHGLWVMLIIIKKKGYTQRAD